MPTQNKRTQTASRRSLKQEQADNLRLIKIVIAQREEIDRLRDVVRRLNDEDIHTQRRPAHPNSINE